MFQIQKTTLLQKCTYYIILLIATSTFVACVPSNNENLTKPQYNWVGTWNTAPQLVEQRNMPPEPGLSNNTLRQTVRVSIGGDSIRIRFSNEFSTCPVTLKKVQIAQATGNSSIDTSTIATLTFNGRKDTTMEAGSILISDILNYNLAPRTDLSISIYFGETCADVTGHPGSRTTSFIVVGDSTNAPNLKEPSWAERWYVINGIDVIAPKQAAAIAILGNSITDGRGSGTNKQNRWPDMLSERLLDNPKTANIGVLNQGIGGNCVLQKCLGPSALERMQRDVINQQGVKWLIILEGINDIGQAPDNDSAMMVAAELIEAYKTLSDTAHAHGIKVYGATILPMGNSFYYSEYKEKARDTINKWIRTTDVFDAVIDFDLAMRNPDDTICLRMEHTEDKLHPNELGYEMMAKSIDLSLFE